MYDRIKCTILAVIIGFLLFSISFAYAGSNQISLKSSREIARVTPGNKSVAPVENATIPAMPSLFPGTLPIQPNEPVSSSITPSPVTAENTPSVVETVTSITSSAEQTVTPAISSPERTETTSESTPGTEEPSVSSPLPASTAVATPGTAETKPKEEATGEKKIDTRWFKTERTNMLVAIVLLSGFIVYFIFSAQRGTELFVRRIAGLSALDDAVGRATEMGKAVLYIPGIMDMDDIQTLAGLSILSYVAQKTAEYDTPIMVPTSRSLVMSTAQEVVKESYMRAGRPDAFRPDNIRYLTDDQFGFVAGVDGIMVRDEPAANFYMGCFYAESLILAETGHSTGAIQMAGTAMPSQLPFFVAACDYTLMGEELYAASAYLSRDPQQLGSLKGQDMCKAVILFCILLGCLLETAGVTSFIHLFDTK